MPMFFGCPNQLFLELIQFYSVYNHYLKISSFLPLSGSPFPPSLWLVIIKSVPSRACCFIHHTSNPNHNLYFQDMWSTLITCTMFCEGYPWLHQMKCFWQSLLTPLLSANVVFLVQEKSTSKPLEWWVPRNLKSPLSLLVSHWTSSSTVS